MAQNPELLSAFLRQGYATYPGAFEAVDRFETEVMAAIGSTFQAKNDWRGVQRRKHGDGWASPVKNARNGQTISAWVPCEPQGGEPNVAISLGLAWNMPRLGPGVVAAYAHYWLGRGTRVVNLVADFAGRVKAGPFDKSDYRLYLVVDETFDLKEGFALPLEAIDSGIASQDPKPPHAP